MTLQVGQTPLTGLRVKPCNGELMFKDTQESAKQDRPSKVETEDHDGHERHSDQTTDGALTVLREEDVDIVVSKVRTYLREATRAHASQPESAHQEDGHYRVSRSDLHGLLCYVVDDVNHLTRDNFQGPKLSPPLGNSTSPSGFQSPRILRPNRSIASLPARHAITLSVPEAYFTLALGLPSGGPQKRHSATTAIIVSPSSVTKMTCPSSPHQQAESALWANCSPTWDTAAAGSSDVGPDEADPKAARRDERGATSAKGYETIELERQDEEEHPARRSSILATLRRKSQAFGQAVGSFVNGAYRNVDYRERRPSSVFRMRAILDRIEPSRPKQDMAVFTAFTGAQPVRPIHPMISADADTVRRPGQPSHTTCSEDGRQHQCVQHELETLPG